MKELFDKTYVKIKIKNVYKYFIILITLHVEKCSYMIISKGENCRLPTYYNHH